MVRVIYRWQVEAHRFDAFQAKWSEATQLIHASVPGALGSMLLRDAADPQSVLTIAKWQSKAEWETFFAGENPVQMQAMRTLGKRISVECFEEVQDHTQ